MLNEKFLLDDFEISGTNVNKFESLIREIDRRTAHVQRCLHNFIIVSIKAPELNSDAHVMSGWYLDPANPVNDGRLRSCTIPKSVGLSNRMEALLKETIQKNPTMLWDIEGKAMWFLSSAATNTMAQRIGVTGNSIREHSLERDLFIAHKFNVEVTSTLIVKQYQQVGKVFSMMSEGYVHIPLYTLCIIYKDLAKESKLGSIICEGWNVTHERVKILFAFKEYAQEISAIYNLEREMIPCVEMTTSDIGESSFVIRGCWKTSEGAIVYDHTFSRQHRGKFNLDELRREIQNQIYDRYTELPERLLELAAIDITPPGLNLQGSKGSGKNHKIVCNAFHSVFKQLGIVSVIGKKKLMSIERYIDLSIIRGDMHYTAYDLVMDVFALSQTMKSYFEREGVSTEMMRKFREEISKAAYVDYFIKKEEFTDVYLTP